MRLPSFPPKLDEWLAGKKEQLNPKNKCKESCFCKEVIKMKPIFEALSIASEFLERELGLYIFRTPAGELDHTRRAIVGRKASITFPKREGVEDVGDFHTHPGGPVLPSSQDIFRMLAKNYEGLCIGTHLHRYKTEIKCYVRGPKFEEYRKRVEELLERIEKANREWDVVEMRKCIIERARLKREIILKRAEIIKECEWEKYQNLMNGYG